MHQLRDHLAQVRRDATTDALTNLGNRKAFDTELRRAHEAAERSGEVLALAVVDIDHFKRCFLRKNGLLQAKVTI